MKPVKIALLSALACAAAVLPTVLRAAPVAASAIPAPTNLAVTAKTPSSISLEWQISSDAARLRQWLATYDGEVGVWSGRPICATCTSVTIDGLVAGRTYSIAAFAEQRNGLRSANATITATTPTGPCTSPDRLCASVTAAQSLGPARSVASGLLHGANAATPTDLIARLKPSSWRISAANATAFKIARAAGAKITVLLSDVYVQNNWNGAHVLRNPWDDWSAYRDFVTATVRWHISNNLVPDWFEIQNEADGHNFYSPTTPATGSLILEQFRVAHDAIRALLPTAGIVGPSFAGLVGANDPLVDLTKFLDYAVANSLKFDVISWHSLGGRSPTDAYTRPQFVADSAHHVRQLLAERPSLGSPVLAVNEFGAPFWQGHPGATVAYFAALERAGVAMANLACFPTTGDGWVTRLSTCFDGGGLLDGLRTVSGAPAADYWTHAAYSQMTGTRVDAVVNDPWASAFATASPDGTISVLVGRARTCVSGVQIFCPSGFSAGAPKVGELVVSTSSKRTFVVSVERVPNIAGPLNAPSLISRTTQSPRKGALHVSLGNVADGDAIVVTARPR